MIKAKNEYGWHFIPDGTEYTYTASKIISGGVHEPETIEFIREAAADKAIIHAGAGFGDFLPALKDLRWVYTFEPNPLNLEAVRASVEANGLQNISVIPCALGSYEGVIDIQVTDDLGRPMGVRTEVASDGHQVCVTTMDAVIPEDVPISIIHLDLEGYEFEALDGARKIIDKWHPIVILEIDKRAVDYNNYMEKLGYYPAQHLVYDSGPMIFVNTVYRYRDEV